MSFSEEFLTFYDIPADERREFVKNLRSKNKAAGKEAARENGRPGARKPLRITAMLLVLAAVAGIFFSVGKFGSDISSCSTENTDTDTGSAVSEKTSESEFSYVSIGSKHSAAITKDGSLYTWGDNNDGQLGNGTTEECSTPAKIMDNVASVSLGYYHSAAITTDGSLYTWGDNDDGELGDGTTEDRTTPTRITIPE